jgi:hypothetical protein
VFYPPATETDFEQMLAGTYTETEWEKLGIEYPRIEYITIDEAGIENSGSGYSIFELVNERSDFTLAKVVEGSTPNMRVLIYKRK